MGPRTPTNAVVIGVTGGIATGKSTITSLLAKHFQANSVVLNADHFGHLAYATGTECLQQMVEQFGERILAEDGSVNRAALGPIVFSDKSALEALNAIVWPAIRALLKSKIAEEAAAFASKGDSDGSYLVVVLEAAVMIEAKWMDLVDEVWVTTIPPEMAKERLMARNKLNAEDAQKRIDSQLTNEQRCQVAHIKLTNDGDKAVLEAQVGECAHELLARYARQSAFEVVDVVSKDTDQVVGTAKRAVVRLGNLVHRCSYIVLTHAESRKVYVQRRSKLKDAGPGLLDPAPGGIVGAGESYQANIEREMLEELGLQLKDWPQVLCVFYHEHELDGRSWGMIFTAEISTPVANLVLQEEEVDTVELMSRNEILALDESKFLPCSLAAFKEYVAKTA